MPPDRRPAPPRGRRRATAAVAVVILVSAVAATWQATRRTTPAAPPVPAPEPSAPPPAPPAPAAEAPDPRPRFLAARATITCGGATGEAVFVAPDRALGSLPCPEGQGQLHLSDGRDLLARTAPGAPAGTSILDLPGAAAAFVAPGDSTTLADGAPLLVGLEGGGPEVTGEASARGYASVAGMALLRAEDAAGPLSGPVLDARGSLVGLVPSSAPDPGRPWLAVPIEAFAGPLAREVNDAWRRAAEEAADVERRAQGDLWGRLRGPAPVLLAAVPGSEGLDLFVARAVAGRPPAETVRLTLTPPVRGCTLVGRIGEWSTGPRAFLGTPVPSEVVGRLNRLVVPVGGGSVWMGRGQARLDCDLSGVPEEATLAVEGSDPVVPVPFPRAGLAAALSRGERRGAETAQQESQAVAQELAARAEEEAAREIGWRDAFREANARIAQAREQVRVIQAQRDDARGNFQYVLEEQLNGDLEAARLEVKRAEMALDDLDRRASLDAVPRAWRRE